MSDQHARGCLSARLYLGCVVAASLMLVGAAMALRPAFAHRVLELTGLEAMPKAAPGSFYAVRVAPLFDQHCTSCHGETRQKADLRLDSYAFVMRGGRHGQMVKPGDAKASELVHRIELPAGDERAMPPEGKTPLSPDDITVIRLWIQTGASAALPAAAVKGAPRLVKPVTIPPPDPERARRERAALAADVAALSARYPGVIGYVSRNSADLIVDAGLRGRAFGDDDLRALVPLGARIVRLDLSGTAITDASAAALAGMPALKTLRLANTRIGDRTIAALAPLRQLQSLAVAGTVVTAASLAPLSARGVMVHGGPAAG